jgi:multidrug efflux pump subunit AcrA (membrane-fusion protein)
MTAVATIESQSLADAWLVPLTAVKEVDGVAQVTVLRDGTPISVTVTPGEIQGEWVAVKAPEIQANDQVMGDVASYVDQEQQLRFGPGGGGQRFGGGGAPSGQ